jgi:hypothetical protein
VSPTLLAAVAAAAVAAAVLYLAARRLLARPAAQSDTEHHSLDWLRTDEHRPLPGGGTPPATADGWRMVTVHGLAAAEDLLDALEAAGYGEQELLVLGNSVFVVRWR